MNRADKYCNSCIHFKTKKFYEEGFCDKIYENNVVLILREDKDKLITDIVGAGVPKGGWRVDWNMKDDPDYIRPSECPYEFKKELLIERISNNV